ARLVLGVAVLEDIVLWLALAVATVMAGKTVLNSREMSVHLISTIGFFGLGLTILPRMVKRINKARFNVIAKQSPVAYTIAVLLGYCVVAGSLHRRKLCRQDSFRITGRAVGRVPWVGSDQSRDHD